MTQSSSLEPQPSDRVYLDHAATTPVRDEVWAAMEPFSTLCFGNPSSLHQEGKSAHKSLEEARESIRSVCRAKDFHLVFTASGTEADNSALVGALLAAKENAPRSAAPIHIVTTAIEHSAVLEVAPLIRTLGGDVTIVGVDQNGRVDPDAVEDAIQPNTCLVSVIGANNEIGVVQDIAEIGRRAKQRGVLVHTDAVQWLGKLRLDLEELSVDLVSVSAHKIYGPKGIGALFVRRGAAWSSMLRGGAQEDGLRAGTENVGAAVGFARAVRLVDSEIDSEMPRLRSLRNRLEELIVERFEGVTINGAREHRVASILSCTFSEIEGESLVKLLNHFGVSVSTASACSTGAHKPSHVLSAMGRGRNEVRGSIRFSLGSSNDERQIDTAVQALDRALRQLRAIAP